VSCVPDVASFSGLSIRDCPFGFLERLFITILTWVTFHKLVTYYAYLILFVQIGSPTKARFNTLNTGPGYHAFSHILVGEDYFFLEYIFVFQADINIQY
jgi:hypothetical protein